MIQSRLLSCEAQRVGVLWWEKRGQRGKARGCWQGVLSLREGCRERGGAPELVAGVGGEGWGKVTSRRVPGPPGPAAAAASLHAPLHPPGLWDPGRR